MSFLKYENWKKKPLEGTPFLSVAIAAQDAEQHILIIIDRIAAYVSSLDYPWELIICDTGSKDKTTSLVKGLNFANMLLFTGEPGKANQVIQKAMLAGRGRYVLFEDIHDSTPIEELGRLLPKLIHERYDLASGARLATQQSKKSSLSLQSLTRQGLRWVLRWMGGLDVQDPECSFRLYSREVVQRVFPALILKGSSLHVEAIYLANKFGYRIAEVPVGWAKATGKGSQGSQRIAAALPDLIKARWNDWNGKYK